MVKLYDRQEEVVQQVKDRLLDYSLCNNSVYLSGEPGTGKTYMGTELANYYNSLGYTVLVVVPPVVRTKWLHLLGKDTVMLTNSKKEKTPFDSSSKKKYLISMEHLNTWINNNWSVEIEKENGQKVSQIQYDEIKEVFSEKILLICDEIHLFTNTKYEALSNLKRFMHKDSISILMTGTIMEGDTKNIANLIRLSHKNIDKQVKRFRPTDYASIAGNDGLENMVRFAFSTFIYKVWQHISVSIALEEIETLIHNKDEERQEVLPIEPIPLETEQKLFNDVIISELSTFMDKDRATHLGTSFLDNPNKPLSYKKRSNHSTRRLKTGSYVDLGLPLADVSFSDTSKYKELVSIVENNPTDKVLIYVNEVKLMKQLQSQLISDGFPTFYLDNQVSKEHYSDFINSNFEENRIGIVNPEKVNVGIDIHAEQLVWYQLMSEIDKMIQAQRRVCRLSSEYKSKVTLFVYDTPYDNQRAEDLSNALKHNAATYGMKQDDPLAQLTGVLLGDIS